MPMYLYHTVAQPPSPSDGTLPLHEAAANFADSYLIRTAHGTSLPRTYLSRSNPGALAEAYGAR